MENCDVQSLNLDKVCRTCLSESENSLFSNCASTEICYFDILQQFSFIQDRETRFPTKLCLKCSTEIERIYIFKKLCESTENALNKYIELNSTSIETHNSNKETTENMNNGSKNDYLIRREKIMHTKNRLCKLILPSGDAKLHKPQKIHNCNFCNRNFNSTYNLRRHLLTHTGERPFKCDICSKSFTRSTYLSEHSKLHCAQTFVCSFCGKTFLEQSILFTHVKTHNTDKNQCDICDLEFPDANSLLKHLKTHENAGNLLCKLCGKLFMKIREFRIHIRKHADKQALKDASYNHECPFCLRGFQTKATLNNHLLTHGEKSFLCSDCGKVFISLPQLRTHMRVHSGVRPFCCQFCNKTFAQRSGLYTHRLIHSGAKPYVCTICSKTFTQSHHRKRHMLVHSGERPFSCTICAKKFAQKENFTVHMRLHTGETPFECSVCTKQFYDSSSMNKHKKCHGNL